MSSGRGSPRTIDYFVLRVCERMGLTETAFDSLSYDAQVRLLAFEQLRREEEAGRV